MQVRHFGVVGACRQVVQRQSGGSAEKLTSAILHHKPLGAPSAGGYLHPVPHYQTFRALLTLATVGLSAIGWTVALHNPIQSS